MKGGRFGTTAVASRGILDVRERPLESEAIIRLLGEGTRLPRDPDPRDRLRQGRVEGLEREVERDLGLLDVLELERALSRLGTIDRESERNEVGRDEERGTEPSIFPSLSPGIRLNHQTLDKSRT